MDESSLLDFIVRAKASTYVGNGQPAPSCRPASHDLKFTDVEWSYLDSYFGGRDFIGEDPRFHIEGFERTSNYERLRRAE